MKSVQGESLEHQRYVDVCTIITRGNKALQWVIPPLTRTVDSRDNKDMMGSSRA